MKKITIMVIALLSVICFVVPVSALTFEFNSTYTGSSPYGPAPWLTMTFTDKATYVELVIASNLASPQYVSNLYFNLNQALTPGSLNFAFQSGTGPAASSITVAPPEISAPGDGKYDFLFAFPTANNVNRLDGTESVVYWITGSGLTANSFNVLGTPGPGSTAGPFLAVAHVQGIVGSEFGSGHIYPGEGTTLVPEPGTMLLLGLGLLGLGIMVRKRS